MDSIYWVPKDDFALQFLWPARQLLDYSPADYIVYFLFNLGVSMGSLKFGVFGEFF